MELGFCPYWFYSKGILIDLFSLVTLLWVSYFAYKMYKMGKQGVKRPRLALKRRRFLSVGFLFMSISFIFKTLAHFSILNTVQRTSDFGLFMITYKTVVENHTLQLLGLEVYHCLMLVGLFMLYSVYEHKQTLSELIIMVYLIIVSSVFSQQGYILYHLTALLFLALLTRSYILNYKKQSNRTSLMIAVSFMILSLSQLIFVFKFMDPMFYVVAETVQLIGYLLFFITLFLVLRDGKKTK